MTGHYKCIVFTSIFFMGSAFGKEATQYLRRNTLSMPEKCTPVPISSDDIKYDSKAFVLLELDGSASRDEIINPTKEDIQSVDNSFLYAYEYLATCDTSFGAERYVVSGNLIKGDTVPTINNNNQARSYGRGTTNGTWLAEISISCNSCGNEGPWQLFKGVSSSSSPTTDANACVCDPPSQADFVNKFREIFAADKKSGNRSSDITILNVTQIPLLVSPDGVYDKELCDTDTSATTYSYDGVCPGKGEMRSAFDFLTTLSPTEYPTESPSAYPTESPTKTVSPTTASPTYFPTTMEPTFEPTKYPTDEPTMEPIAPTDKPTMKPTDAPSASSSKYSVYFANTCNNIVKVSSDGKSKDIQAKSCQFFGNNDKDSVTYSEVGAAESGGEKSCKNIGSSNNDKCNLLGMAANACVITIDLCNNE